MNNLNYVELTEEIRKFAQENEKESRYEHSIRVAKTCAKLCDHYGINKEEGYLVGMAHDICKYFSEEELFALAKKDGKPILEVENKNPCLLHGRAAAVYVKENFNVLEHDIIEAIALHTSGECGMCDLAKCLWLADKIEPGRKWSSYEYIESLLKFTLNEVFYKVFLDYYKIALERGYELYPNTVKIIEYYKKRVES